MTVLNVIELTKTAPVMNTIFLSSVVLVILSFIGIINTPASKEKLGVACATVLFIALISTIVCGAIKDNFTVPNGKVRYEVLINDDTSFTEVIEKYEIIEQRGEIFVLEEKE